MNELTRIHSDIEAPARFTVDEFVKLVETNIFEGSKVELVEGVIVRMNLPHTPHMFYHRQVFLALHLAFLDNDQDYIAQFELSLELGIDTIRVADVGVIKDFGSQGRFPDATTTLIAVEVSATTLSYDLKNKGRDYARAGIPHFWVVDVEGRRVHALSTPLDGDYAERRLYPFGIAMPVPLTDQTITIG